MVIPESSAESDRASNAAFDPGELTQLLIRWQAGDQQAANYAVAALYPLLHQCAGRQLRASSATISTTELVAESYLRLEQQQVERWASRDHFLAVYSTIVRRTFLDYLKKRNRKKRGGDMIQVAVEEPELGISLTEPLHWLEFGELLDKLDQVDPEISRLIDMRVFGGLDVNRCAEMLGVSVPTVVRRWRFVRALIEDQIRG